MKPLRLTWRLSSPIATSGYPIHLDALVAFALTSKKLQLLDDEPGDREDQQTTIRELARELPLQKAERGGDFVWKASALKPTEGSTTGHGMRFWTRRTDAVDYADTFKRGLLHLRADPENLKPYSMVIDTNRGLLKNGYKFYPVKSIAELEAWCIGDPDALQELLDPAAGSPIASIGARGRSGHGLISSFSMVEDRRAEDLWSQRAMPWTYPGAVEMEIATKPPYWDQGNKQIGFLNPELVL